MHYLSFIIELAGTAAFAVSGAMTAVKKRMDLFGVLFLGLTAAVGGGVIRDLLIGATPPQAFQTPVYLFTACITALFFFLPQVRRRLMANQKWFERILFLGDSVGLAVFTVSGIRTALAQPISFHALLLVFVGLLTGTGGGVLRDLLAGDTPYIFVKHIYATASLAGAVIYLIFYRLNDVAAGVAAMIVIFVIRCLAAQFRLNLPRAQV